MAPVGTLERVRDVCSPVNPCCASQGWRDTFRGLETPQKQLSEAQSCAGIPAQQEVRVGGPVPSPQDATSLAEESRGPWVSALRLFLDVQAAE